MGYFLRTCVTSVTSFYFFCVDTTMLLCKRHLNVVELFLNKPKKALHFQFLITLTSESFWRIQHTGS